MAATAIAVLVKGTVLLLATFGATAALRGASAAARHFVWAVGLAALVVLPLAELSVPWRLEVLPWSRPEAAAPADPAPTLPPEVAGRVAPDVEAAPAAASPVEAEIRAEAGAGASGEVVAGSPPPAGSAVPAESGFGLPEGWDRGRALLVLWAAGAAFVLARLAVSMASVLWLARRARALTSPDWYGPLGRVTERLSLRTPVRLLTTDRTPMPITCGILRPSVLLPEGAEAWDEERREVVLLHELAHVRRADLVPHLLGWVACAVWWFHPMAWLAAKRLRAESEFACDDLVLRAGTRASAYAEHLLAIVRSAGRASSPAPAMPMAQRKGFEGRLLTILEPDLERGRPSRARRAGVVAAFAAVAVSLAAMAPVGPDPDPSGTDVKARETVDGADDATDGWLALEGPADARGADRDAETDRSVETDRNAETGLVIDGMEVDADTPASAGGAVWALVGEIARQADEKAAKKDDRSDADKARDVTRLVAELGLALKDVDAEVRVAAAQALGGIDDPRSVEALSKALRNDASADVRRAAAWALGEIESPAAIPALAEAIRRDSDVEVRKTAAWALGEIESDDGVEALGAALSDSSAEVRAMAIWALGEIETPSAVPWLVTALRDGSVEERRKAAWALGEIESPEAVDGLGAALSDSDAEVREQAAWALGEIESPRAVTWLARAVRDGSVEVRKKAVWALGEIESPEAVGALESALSDGDAEVRSMAAWALGEIQPERAPRTLLDAARDSSSKVREYVAWALGEIEDPAAIPTLRAMLDDANDEVRKDALHALMEFDDALAEDVLLELLKSDDAKVRQEAAKALGERGSR